MPGTSDQLTQFAVDSQPEIDRIEATLARSVRIALSRRPAKGWEDALVRRMGIILSEEFREATGQRSSMPLRAERDRLMGTARASLGKATDDEDRNAQIARITGGLSTALLNSIQEVVAFEEAEDPGELVKTWISMDDARVRPAHAAANGQTVEMGDSYEVAGVKMIRPGDMSAPIELWANCRCVSVVHSRAEEVDDSRIAAAEEEGPRDSAWIMARPADDDPIWNVSSEDPPHVTLAYLGKVEDLRDGAFPDFQEDLQEAVSDFSKAFESEVVGQDTLGDDEADVLLLDEALAPIRNAILAHVELAEAEHEARTYDSWLPHLTLGYPDTPRLSDDLPNSIRFTKVQLWVGEQHAEFDIPGGEDMPVDDTETEDLVEETDPSGVEYDTRSDEIALPIHGVLALEDTVTRDNRVIDGGALWQETPMPLLWQEKTDEGHDQSVIVGRIDDVYRDGPKVMFTGALIDTPHTDQVVNLLAEKALRGVSIDLGDMEGEVRNESGEMVDETNIEAQGKDVKLLSAVTVGEVMGATLVPFPAFSGAYVALGHPAELDEEPVDQPEVEVPSDEEIEAMVASAEVDLRALVAAISESEWDGSPGRFTLEQYHQSCIVHRHDGAPESKDDCSLPIKEPNGDLSRAGVHAAAGRIGQTDASDEQLSKARGSLRSAYKQLGEDPPEGLAASGEFVDVAPGKTEDGPGWLTHPIETDRLRDYWVRGPGAAKIIWGVPGDFNRCRTLLAAYVKPQHLSGYCANRHKDALGVWPGQESLSAAVTAATNDERGEAFTMGEVALVASLPEGERPPASWFEDPQLTGPSALSVTEDGRVFGHLATWGTCHVGFPSECVEPPRSKVDYARFMTGAFLTRDGEVPVGTITLGTGHADRKLKAAAAVAHYDDTGTAVAYVAAGEDEFGIWVAGKMKLGYTPEQEESLRAASLSGDWRRSGGNLELVAALAVNVAGFPIERVALAASASGELESLVAANVVEGIDFSRSEIAAIVGQVMDEREEKKMAVERVQALKAKRNARKINAMRKARA